MLSKQESDNLFMFCLEELKLLADDGHCPDRLSVVIAKLEILHQDSREEIPYYEQRVIDLLKDRLLGIGLADYGALNLVTDKRDFIQESLEEVTDVIVYLMAKLIQIHDKEKT